MHRKVLNSLTWDVWGFLQLAVVFDVGWPGGFLLFCFLAKLCWNWQGGVEIFYQEVHGIWFSFNMLAAIHTVCWGLPNGIVFHSFCFHQLKSVYRRNSFLLISYIAIAWKGLLKFIHSLRLWAKCSEGASPCWKDTQQPGSGSRTHTQVCCSTCCSGLQAGC